MRNVLSVFLCLFFSSTLLGQDFDSLLQGNVSYVTSQSVYVKFSSTEGIDVGDTLYSLRDNALIPVLEVKNLSSISCVCTSMTERQFNQSDVVYFRIKPPTIEVDSADTIPTTVLLATQEKNDSIAPLDTTKKNVQSIRGRLAISSYSNFSNTEAPGNQRMRYTFSFTGDHLGGSNVSFETYMSFVHSNANWDDVKDDLFNGLKIYNLAVRYDFKNKTSIWLGRKINPTITNVGAIDGLQFEKKIKSFVVGAFGGSRPDYMDYGFNFDLLQYGAYFGHVYARKRRQAQSSMAYIEQNNSGNTDRRFLYFQHSNTLLRNLFFFGTLEVDLYKKLNDKPENTFDLTNLYVSLRYKIIKELSITASYSARNNIIYYETYKNFIDRILETETLQGWRVQLNYRPIKYLAVGLKGGYRYRKPDPEPSTNYYAYVTHSRIPGIKASMTLSITGLQTSYLTGNIYSMGISRDLLPGILSGGFNYRMVDYTFRNSETDLPQHIFDVNLFWRIYKKLSLSVNYEGTFENERSYNRIFINLSQRF